MRHGCIPSDVLQKKASEGEGACSPTEAERPHLPLRGKLGWMTPRAGWRQPESECTHSHFPWQRIDLTFLHLLPSSSISCERAEAAVGVDPHHRRIAPLLKAHGSGTTPGIGR